MHGLARGTSRAICLAGNVKTLANLLGRKARTQVILRNDRQVWPNAKQIFRMFDSSSLSPFRQRICARSKITNLAQQSLPQLFSLFIRTKLREPVQVGV